MFSEKVKNALSSQRAHALANIVFPLPAAEHSYAAVIEIERWLALPIDRRAPVRSVALVDLVGERFLGLVIDTVAERPRWLVEGNRSQLSSLYEGMFGCDPEQARRALVISTQHLERWLTPATLTFEALRNVTGVSDNDSQTLRESQVPSPDPGGGTRGVIVAPTGTLYAGVQAHVSDSLSGASEVQISDANGNTYDALAVPNNPFG